MIFIVVAAKLLVSDRTSATERVRWLFISCLTVLIFLSLLLWFCLPTHLAVPSTRRPDPRVNKRLDDSSSSGIRKRRIMLVERHRYGYATLWYETCCCCLIDNI